MLVACKMIICLIAFLRYTVLFIFFLFILVVFGCVEVHADPLLGALERKWETDYYETYKNRAKVKIKKATSLKKLNASCKKADIYLATLGDFEIEVLNLKDEGDIADIRSLYNGGSGGKTYTIFLFHDGKINILFDSVLISFVGVQGDQDCPPLEVIVHGSYFDRAGKLYGKASLTWNGKEYELKKNKNKGEK